MREGDKVDVNPKAFVIQNERLLLFYDGWLGDTRKSWLNGDGESLEMVSDGHWNRLSGESPPDRSEADSGGNQSGG